MQFLKVFDKEEVPIWMKSVGKYLSNLCGCTQTTYTWVHQCHFSAYFDCNTGDILKCYAEFEKFDFVLLNVNLGTDPWLSLLEA